jgi:hypothetical protein
MFGQNKSRGIISLDYRTFFGVRRLVAAFLSCELFQWNEKRRQVAALQIGASPVCLNDARNQLVLDSLLTVR